MPLSKLAPLFSFTMPPPTKLPAHEPESPPEALETIPRLSPTKALDMYHPPAAHEPTEPMPMEEPAAAIPTEAFEVLSSSMDALQGASDACSAPTPFVYATFALMILNILLVGAVAYAMYRQSKSSRRAGGHVPSPELRGAARESWYVDIISLLKRARDR